MASSNGQLLNMHRQVGECVSRFSQGDLCQCSRPPSTMLSNRNINNIIIRSYARMAVQVMCMEVSHSQGESQELRYSHTFSSLTTTKEGRLYNVKTRNK